ncbi:hypothetical protein EO94_00490 [Methanosarcina sp. 2.H.T.1A.3]|nr:hypothetical protein EO97_14220 [Methanosarcina sp. 2.H.T.1A.15]KKG16696.1 hypothetical protein EO94_00490 [Methanosarcina sp. 2.H.T.1A.3]
MTCLKNSRVRLQPACPRIRKEIISIPKTVFSPIFIGYLRQLVWRPCKKEARRQKKKRLKNDMQKSIFQIEFNSAPFGILTGFFVDFPCWFFDFLLISYRLPRSFLPVSFLQCSQEFSLSGSYFHFFFV